MKTTIIFLFAIISMSYSLFTRKHHENKHVINYFLNTILSNYFMINFFLYSIRVVFANKWKILQIKNHY